MSNYLLAVNFPTDKTLKDVLKEAVSEKKDNTVVEEEKKDGEIEEPKEEKPQENSKPEVPLPLEEIHTIDEQHKIALLRFDTEAQAIKYYVAKRPDAELKLITSHQVSQLLDPRYYSPEIAKAKVNPFEHLKLTD